MRGVHTNVLALAIARSSNAKIGDAAATYAAQQSCPSDCVFKDGGGCYAENGRIASGVTIPLNAAAAARHATALDVALAEARAIDDMEVVPGRPMRLHTVGDCATNAAARIVAAAAERYMSRGGGRVWTYTHAWRVVARESWGRVSALASCETPEDCEVARAAGYAPSIVIEQFASHKRYQVGTAAVLPCPAQTHHDVSCSSCRLCFDDQALLRRDYVIAFAVHGTAYVVKKATMALRDPGNPDRRLTSRDFIASFLTREGRWPTAREVVDGAKVVRASAREMLEKMRAEQVDYEVAA